MAAFEQAQRGICTIPEWYNRTGPIYRQYASFKERFDDVDLALRESKAACRSLFNLIEFPARLAWNPLRESNRGVTNALLNEQKNTVQALGIQTDGNVMPDKNKKPTAMFQEKSGRIKKRRNKSDRAKVADRLLAPNPAAGPGRTSRSRPIEDMEDWEDEDEDAGMPTISPTVAPGQQSASDDALGFGVSRPVLGTAPFAYQPTYPPAPSYMTAPGPYAELAPFPSAGLGGYSPLMAPSMDQPAYGNEEADHAGPALEAQEGGRAVDVFQNAKLYDY
ncbi:Uu.00g054600.m01.CDS01 [Anthostomella pinea]|uniref:Uu.00g054600.m01.CDS01 n=1 Tax=Anthostomella pinea TaxID=933095 RepID=A0AAI8VXA5_9PEZI|nr:Uu.00g054600.m01.CDS01 [Anthostomella pinea]